MLAVGMIFKLAGGCNAQIKLAIKKKNVGRKCRNSLKSSDWYVHHHRRDAAYKSNNSGFRILMKFTEKNNTNYRLELNKCRY
jgi:hypothetical protein